MPVGPKSGGGSLRMSGAPRRPNDPQHSAGHCRRCGKVGELDDGLCSECKWEIKVGIAKPAPQGEKKHHFWSFNR